MTDVVGRGVIELVGDGRKLQASINDAKKAIRTLGEGQKDISAGASQSIDKYIGRLQQQNATLGKSTRETELYKLALRGASNEQLNAANATLKLAENHKATERLVSTLKTGMIAAAAAATAFAGSMIAMVVSAINAADHLRDLSKTTGISVENLSGLALAAKQSGSDLDGAAKSISFLSKNIGANAEEFAKLGITSKDPLEAFKQLSDIFVSIEDPQVRAAVAAKALGKAWESAAPLLSEGSKSIGEMVEKGKRLSGITKEMSDESDKLKDSLAELKATSAGIGAKMAGDMLPAFNDITKAIMLAYEESGKLSALWVGMGSIGAFLFTDEFASARVKLKTLSDDLTTLELNQAGLAKNAPEGGMIATWLWGDKGELERQIAAKKAEIAALQKSIAPRKAETPWSGPVDMYGQPVKSAAEKRAAAFIDDGKGDKAAARLAATELSLYTGALQKLEIELGKSTGMTVAQQVAYETSAGSLQKLTKEHKANLISVAAEVDTRKQFLSQSAQIVKFLDEQEALARTEGLAANEGRAWSEVLAPITDATEAAQFYIDTINRQNEREIAGIGRGEKFRTKQAGISAIEDKQIVERQRLDAELRKGQIDKEVFDRYLAVANDTYAKEIAAYDKRTDTLIEKESDWLNGATEAMQNYYDESRNIAKQTEQLFTRAFQSMEDALVKFVQTGKLDFKSLADSIVADLIRIQVRQAMASVASSAGGGFFANLFGGSSGPEQLSGPGMTWGGAQAKGGDYLVTKPTLFLAGEAGPERASFGGAAGGGATNIFQVDMRGASVEAVQRLERLVASVNGSIETRALGVVRQARVRGAR